MNRLHLIILTSVLCIVGLSLFTYKALVLRFPLTPNTTSSLWTVEAAVSFVCKKKPIKLSLYIPRSNRFTAVVDENFISRGFGFTTRKKKYNRNATWSVRRCDGLQRLFYRAVIRKLDPEEIDYALPPAKESKPKFEGAYLAATESIIEQIRRTSADTDTFVEALLDHLKNPESDENARLLLGRKPDSLKRAIVGARILNVAGIPARAAHGILLQDQLRFATIEHWVEAYDKDHWTVYGRRPDEVSGATPSLVWWRGERSIAEIVGANNLQVQLSVSQNQEDGIDSALVRAGISGRPFLEYSLFRLPIQTQAVYRVILLVPIGALLIVFLRNIVGIKTFGTFMPVLLSLAFRETQLLSGIVLVVVIVAIGLAARFYLEQLKLLLVPRLASVVVIVVLTMAFLSILTNRLGLHHGLSVALFPMVILTMVIERMSITWEEMGPATALRQAAGTLATAALAYLVISIRLLGHIIFVFPELLLVVLAVLLLLGRYTGYRLLELRRFRSLVKENGTKDHVGTRSKTL